MNSSTNEVGVCGIRGHDVVDSGRVGTGDKIFPEKSTELCVIGNSLDHGDRKYPEKKISSINVSG